jgi:general secretion pathway protein J
MKARSQAGFTLIEIIVAMTLLATMMLLLYSGLSFALRSWDAGDANGRRTADRRIGENFLRRELTELFPMRWKDGTALRFAFEGDARHLRFVSSRPAGVSTGGLALVGVEVEEGERRNQRDLVMRRAMPDDDAKDFRPLDRAERAILVAGIDSVAFSYFGSLNDFTEPVWTDTWPHPGRIPQMVRVRVTESGGATLPELVVKLMLGEEAGCLENSFQRMCRPRRP